MSAQDALEALRRRPILLLLPAVVAAALWLDELALAVPTICPWKLTTGLPCAGCGLTRAFIAMAGGQWREAVAFNPLAPLVLLAMGGWWVAAWRSHRRGEPTPGAPRWLVAVALVLAVGLHIGRALHWLPQPG